MTKLPSNEQGSGEEQVLGFFERHLTFWVLACMAAGTVLGATFPRTAEFFNSLAIAQVNIPVALFLFGMMYPIMVRIDFGEVVEAAKNPKPVAITLFVNWAIKPFTMLFFAWLFMRHVWAPFIAPEMATSYIAGMILLGIAPCTAMVLVWSYLAHGFMGHTLVMVAVNSLTMLILYAPLGSLLLGATAIPVPFVTMFAAIMFYVGVALVAGYFTRTRLIRTRGVQWYETVFLKHTGKVSMVALLLTLVFLFMLQGDVILAQPGVIAMIALPLVLQTLFIFAIAYAISKLLRLTYEDAAPTSMIGASNHFEVAIATATTLFGLGSGAALATVVGVLIEVPLMLMLVRICLATKHWFPRKRVLAPALRPYPQRAGGR